MSLPRETAIEPTGETAVANNRRAEIMPPALPALLRAVASGSITCDVCHARTAVAIRTRPAIRGLCRQCSTGESIDLAWRELLKRRNEQGGPITHR